VTPTLNHICDKVHAGQRLTAADGEFLFHDAIDLHEVGQLADLVRRRKNGNFAYYNLNAHLNPTNVCIYRCPLCAYSCDPDDPRAYVLGPAEILARGREATEHGCTELHIVGGVHPARDFSWSVEILRSLHAAFPGLHLKAWTAVEIAAFSQRAGRPVQAILEELMAAGLGSLPGGGAEIFAPAVRRQISPAKANGDTWLAVHRTAHRLGLRSNATMLFGHLETPQQRIDHLLQLRSLQDETGGFQAFIPLAFHPDHTGLAHLCKPTGLESLRVVAISRLMLDNFDHIKAYWISLGVGTAQVALAYGADDLDGTVRHEAIHHRAGAESPEVLSVEQLQHLIREAGCEPIERDSLYRRVQPTSDNSSTSP
jgi:aminodeoxyfutalosine synthase